MLSTVLYYELDMKVPNPVGITVYLLTSGLGHLRCLVPYEDGGRRRGLVVGVTWSTVARQVVGSNLPPARTQTTLTFPQWSMTG